MKEWERFLSTLESELSAKVVEAWLRPLRIIQFDAANLYLEASDPMAVAWFEEHIRPRLKYKFFNQNNRPIRVHLQTKGSDRLLKPTQREQQSIQIEPDSLDPAQTLDHFVLQPSNEVAYKLIREWTVKGTVLFNPIFLFGPKSSGKTHLLTAIAIELSKQGKRVFFVSTNRFTEHVVQAIRTANMQEFRRIYREIDILLVDNIDQLGGRAATQEEFFHTFNALHTSGKQIILSSQSAPSKLQDIEPRLISRFEWGIALSLDKVPPAAAIREKAKVWNIPLDDALLEFLIEKFPIDPITALQALSVRAPKNVPIGVSAAEKLLSDLIRKETDQALSPEQIIRNVSAHFGIMPEDLLSKSQLREFALPRQIAMFACRELLKLPFQAIGKFFGRDHSTVMSSAKLIQKGIEEKNLEWIEAVEAASKQPIKS